MLPSVALRKRLISFTRTSPILKPRPRSTLGHIGVRGYRRDQYATRIRKQSRPINN